MTYPSIDSLKNEVADCYIMNFQKELGWLQGIVILPLKSGMKDILSGKTELPENFKGIENFMFWKDIIRFFSKDFANKIFNFLKVKRQEIVSRQTVPELLELKNEILGEDKMEQNFSQDNLHVQSSNGFQQTNVKTSPTREENKEENNQPEKENDKSNNINPVVAGATTAVGVYGANKLRQLAKGNNVENVVKNLDDEKMIGSIEGVIDRMKKQRVALQSRLTPHQLKTVENQIEELEKGLSEMKEGGVTDMIKDWYEVREQLPAKLLTKTFDKNLLEQIDKLSGQLNGKTVNEIKDILKNNGITKIDDSLELLECISKAKNAKQIKQMVKVVKCGSKFTTYAKTLAYTMRVDVAFLGIDVWAYIEENKEAELISKIDEIRGKNKHNQAMFHLRTGLGSVIAESLIVLGVCASGGSYGGAVGTLVGLAIGAIELGVSNAGNALYYDVRDFYQQIEIENFLSQSRGKIKQAILQGIHNYKMGDTSMNEKFATWASTHNIEMNSMYLPVIKTNGEDLNNWLKNKETSLETACRSMIFLEEIEDGTGELKNNRYLIDYVNSRKTKDDFLKDKEEEYKDEKDKYEEYKENFNKYREQMAARIDKRMEYVKKELDKPDIINSIYAGVGAQRLTQVFTESKGFANMSDDNKRDDSKSYSENLSEYKEGLFKDFPHEKVEKLESIRENNTSLFLDIITTTQLSGFVGEEETDENYKTNVKLVETYNKYMSMFENLEDKHYLDIADEERNYKFIYNLLKSDFELEDVEYPTMKSDDELFDIVGIGTERRGLTEISDNILQNILYKLAKQLNGYSGMNDMYNLMEFYGEDEDDNNGIYFSSKRKINEDRAIDTSIVKYIPKVFHEADVDRYVESFMGINFYGKNRIIDTNTESIDDQLTTELISVIEGIVREELKNHTVENQNKIKEQIKTVITKNSKGEFMELPYYLILEAKKAGLGDLQRQFFRLNQSTNTIEVCYMDKEYNTTSIFGDDCEKLYISTAREEFTEKEKAYIDRVDAVCEKLREIKSVECVEGLGLARADRHEDDLDLPVEVEHIISDKMIERENFKNTVLSYDANTCNADVVINKYREYAEYFESLYRGILFSEAGFSVSNDIDSFKYFQSVMKLGSTNLFTDEGKIDIESIKTFEQKGFDFILKDDNHEFEEFYEKLFSNLKFQAKGDNTETLEYRWKRGDSDQKELARRVSYDIITTTLEKCLLLRDGYGKLNIISYGRMDRRKSLKDDIESDVKKHIKEMKILSNIDIDEIAPLMHEKKIKRLSEGEKQATDLTQIINDLMKEKNPQLDWRDRRLQLQYDIDNSTINSWGEETKILIEEEKNGSGKSFRISGLNIKFTDLKEGIRTANLINWLKYNMKNELVGKKANGRPHPDANIDEYKRESGSLMREVKNDINDIEILTESTIDVWYPTIKESNEFLRFINNLLEFITTDNGSSRNNNDVQEEWEKEEDMPTSFN